MGTRIGPAQTRLKNVSNALEMRSHQFRRNIGFSVLHRLQDALMFRKVLFAILELKDEHLLRHVKLENGIDCLREDRVT